MVIFSKDRSPANVNRGRGWTEAAIRRWLKYYGQESPVLGCYVVPDATTGLTAARAAGVIGSHLLWSKPSDDDEQIVLRATASVAFVARANSDGDERPSFRIRAYNGAVIKPPGWGRTVIDLAGLKAAEPVAILLDHQLSQIVGQSTAVEIGQSTIDIRGIVTGDVESDGDPARKVLVHAKNGFKWRASVGISPSAIEDVSERSSVDVNGKSFAGPLACVRAGILIEVSFLSAGADKNAFAQVAATVAEAALEARC